MNFLLFDKPFSVVVAVVVEIVADTVVAAVGYLETRSTAVVLPSDGIQHERNLTNFVRIRRFVVRQNSYQNWFEYRIIYLKGIVTWLVAARSVV